MLLSILRLETEIIATVVVIVEIAIEEEGVVLALLCSGQV